LTLRVEKRTLRSVLEEVGRKAELAIILGEDIGDEQVSVDLKHQRLDEALRQILLNHDAFFFYGVAKGEHTAKHKRVASLKAVWVYAASRGEGWQPVPPHTWASTKELERMLNDRDGDVRARTITELIKRKGPDSGNAVLDAFKDPSDDVRTGALYQALSSEVEIPQGRLVDLLLYDESENVRFLALRALSGDPSLRWVVERAAQDTNPRVSETAQRILQQLDAANQPPTGPAITQQHDQSSEAE
jgi:hypothetical protein